MTGETRPEEKKPTVDQSVGEGDAAADTNASDGDAASGDSASTFSTVIRRLGPAGFLGLAWTVMPGVCGFILLANIGVLSDWLNAHQQLGVAIYIGVFIVSAGLGLLPTYAQAVLGGWVFGVAVGMPAALAGFTGGSLVGYIVARSIAHDRVEKVIEDYPKARAVRRALVGRGFWPTLGIVTLIRVPPNSPFALTNGVLATSGVRPFPYALGTLLGMTPRTAVAVAFAAAGSEQARDIQEFVKEGPGLWVLIGGIVSMIIVLMIIAHISNKAIQRVIGNGEESPRQPEQP